MITRADIDDRVRLWGFVKTWLRRTTFSGGFSGE